MRSVFDVNVVKVHHAVQTRYEAEEQKLHPVEKSGTRHWNHELEGTTGQLLRPLAGAGWRSCHALLVPRTFLIEMDAA
jgi:hypothetical protein